MAKTILLILTCRELSDQAGRLDRKIEISLPYEQVRMEISKIHSNPITKHGDIDFVVNICSKFFTLSNPLLLALVKLSDGFNGIDLRNVCKKLETKLDYKPVENFISYGENK